MREFFWKTTVYMSIRITCSWVLVGKKQDFPKKGFHPYLSLFSFIYLRLCVKFLFGFKLVFLGTIKSTFKHFRARQYVKCLMRQYLKEVPRGVMLKII